MNEQPDSNSQANQQDDQNFWDENPDSILVFNVTKRECKAVLDEILVEYADLIKRMKYV